MACDKNTQKIKTMFDEISSYYDFMNNFISFGTHYILKFLALKELNIQPRTMILDLCSVSTGCFFPVYSSIKIFNSDA